MDELGELLREAREAKGLTLAQVQEKIRINSQFLDALESGQHHLLPTPVHVRGFLRNYARFLGLDPQPILERYETAQSRRPASSSLRNGASLSSDAPIPPREDQPFFVPVDVDLDGGGRRGSDSVLRLLIIAALLIALFLAGNRFIPMFLGSGDGTEALSAIIEDILANSDPDELAQEMEDTAGEVNPMGSEQEIVNTGINNMTDAPTSSLNRPQLPATMDRVQLRLDVTERTWMRVTIDGAVVFEGLARRGEGPFEWEAAQEARFLTGNAAGVYVTINGIELGRLGGRGEIADEVWSVTTN